METATFVQKAARHGIRFEAEGAVLVFFSETTLTPNQIRAIEEREAELLAWIKEAPPSSVPASVFWLEDFSELIDRARRGELAKGRKIALSVCATCDDLNLYVTLAEPRIRRTGASNLLHRDGLLEQEREALHAVANAQAAIEVEGGGFGWGFR